MEREDPQGRPSPMGTAVGGEAPAPAQPGRPAGPEPGCCTGLPQQQAGTHQAFPGAGANNAIGCQAKETLERLHCIFSGWAIDPIHCDAGQRISPGQGIQVFLHHPDIIPAAAAP